MGWSIAICQYVLVVAQTHVRVLGCITAQVQAQRHKTEFMFGLKHWRMDQAMDYPVHVWISVGACAYVACIRK